MRNRTEGPIKGVPRLVRSSDKDTNKMIVKKQKRMLSRLRKKRIHPRKGDIRLINAFGTKGRMVFIGSFD